jgi:hypothetical protein
VIGSWSDLNQENQMNTAIAIALLIVYVVAYRALDRIANGQERSDAKPLQQNTKIPTHIRENVGLFQTFYLFFIKAISISSRIIIRQYVH